MQALSRRSFLAASCVTTTGALAGCSGGSDSSGTSPTTTAPRSTPDSLAIENVHVCSQQPTGYRQYTEQPAATYAPTDTVWVYFEPSTVGTTPAGEGQVDLAFDIQWTIVQPAGEELDTLTRTAERTVPSSADLSSLFLWLDFAPPTPFESGTYTVEIEVTDSVAGTTATDTVEFDVERQLTQAAGSFDLAGLEYLATKPAGYRTYTPQPDADFRPGDTVWYYIEVEGVHYEKRETTKVLAISASETLTGPEGETWAQQDLPLSNEMAATTDLSTYFIAGQFSPTDRWLPGSYTHTLSVTDDYTDKQRKVTGTFSVTE